MKHLLLALLLVSLSMPAAAHWEDPDGCHKLIDTLRQYSWTSVYEGVSEDGRDYIKRHQADQSPLMVELHYILLPEGQWENRETPSYLPQELSVWLDWDGDSVFSEWYLDPRGHGECADILHFVWSSEKQSYVLVRSGKEIL